jgi:hypothetical protein
LILPLSKLCPCISWNWTSLVVIYISLWLLLRFGCGGWDFGLYLTNFASKNEKLVSLVGVGWTY